MSGCHTLKLFYVIVSLAQFNMLISHHRFDTDFWLTIILINWCLNVNQISYQFSPCDILAKHLWRVVHYLFSAFTHYKLATRHINFWNCWKQKKQPKNETTKFLQLLVLPRQAKSFFLCKIYHSFPKVLSILLHIKVMDIKSWQK